MVEDLRGLRVIAPEPRELSPGAVRGADTASLMECIVLNSSGAKAVEPSRYNDSRIGTNFRYDNFYPILIINVTSVEDIQAGVKCAGQLGVRVAVMNGGHSFEGMSCTNDLLLHLDEFNGVTIEKSSDGPVAIVQSGIRLARLYGAVIQYSAEAAAAGATDTLVVAGGTCPTVGVTGHTLCGGYGMLGRHVGLTSDQIVSIRLVTPAGEVVTADATNGYRDVFWAMKGGCSSAFGIVVSITFRLLSLPSPTVTTVDMLLPYDSPDIEGAAVWWQHWATAEAVDTCTSTLTFQSDGLRLQAVYLGSKSDSNFLELMKQISVGLKDIVSPEDIWAAATEGTFLDAVLWWSQDDSLQSVEDLLAVKSLDPLETRSHSRRKSKSLLALKHVVPREAVRSIIDMRVSKELNAVEWKAYGGVNHLSDAFYWDDRSPLLRGHLMEMHYGNSYGGDGSDEQDEELVQQVNAVGEGLQKYFTGPTGYIG